MMILLGLVMIYSIVHFFIMQHSKNWKERSTYEKVVSVAAMVCIGLVLLGVMFG